MSDDCTPRWHFTADGPNPFPLPYPCADALCPRPGAHGSLEVAMVVGAGQAGPWTLTRDGDAVLIDHAAAPVVGALGHGSDGCGHDGALYVLNDPVAFGFHTYVLENPNADLHAVAREMAGGPGSDAIVPGLVLGVALVALGKLLERVPLGWGI